MRIFLYDPVKFFPNSKSFQLFQKQGNSNYTYSYTREALNIELIKKFIDFSPELFVCFLSYDAIIDTLSVLTTLTKTFICYTEMELSKRDSHSQKQIWTSSLIHHLSEVVRYDELSYEKIYYDIKNYKHKGDTERSLHYSRYLRQIASNKKETNFIKNFQQKVSKIQIYSNQHQPDINFHRLIIRRQHHVW